MEKFLKKVKDFEEVLFTSSEYAEEQLKKFKLPKLGEVGEQVEQQLKRYAGLGISKNNDLNKDNESYENLEDNKNNDSKNSFKGEFMDSLEDFMKQDCRSNENEQPFIEGFNLRDAMIAKEILDKPLCKRRRREFRGGR